MPAVLLGLEDRVMIHAQHIHIHRLEKEAYVFLIGFHAHLMGLGVVGIKVDVPQPARTQLAHLGQSFCQVTKHLGRRLIPESIPPAGWSVRPLGYWRPAMGNGLEPMLLAKCEVLLHRLHREPVHRPVYHREIRLGNLGKPLVCILIQGKSQPESPDTKPILHKPRPSLGRSGPS